jgi:hypothetical protein
MTGSRALLRVLGAHQQTQRSRPSSTNTQPSNVRHCELGCGERCSDHPTSASSQRTAATHIKSDLHLIHFQQKTESKTYQKQGKLRRKPPPLSTPPLQLSIQANYKLQGKATCATTGAQHHACACSRPTNATQVSADCYKVVGVTGRVDKNMLVETHQRSIATNLEELGSGAKALRLGVAAVLG